jgi:hypothetical protein
MEERVAIMQRILEVMVVLQVRYSIPLFVIRYLLFVVRNFIFTYAVPVSRSYTGAVGKTTENR